MGAFFNKKIVTEPAHPIGTDFNFNFLNGEFYEKEAFNIRSGTGLQSQCFLATDSLSNERNFTEHYRQYDEFELGS